MGQVTETHHRFFTRLACLFWATCLMLACALTACTTGRSVPIATGAAPTPPFAANDTLETLRAELARVLAQRGIELGADGRPRRSVSAAPRREYLAPTRENLMGSAVLGWRHWMLGDYDQNGEANIADLTPIGIHLGKNAASPDWDIACMADGDRDGEVTIADVTPLGLNFGAVCDGYVVEARLGPNSPWREFGNVPFASANSVGPFRELAYTAHEAVGETEFRVAPVAATREFDWTVYALDLGAGVFQLPAIGIVGGHPALAIVDTANYVLHYAYSTSPQPMTPGDWTIVKADYQQPDWIDRPALREIGGLPALVYIDRLGDGSNGGLFYCRALSTTPRSRELEPFDWVSYQLDSGNYHSAPPALIERDGLPLVFYGDPTNALRMAAAGNTAPAPTDWTIIEAYHVNTWPLGASPALIAGQPVIAFSNLNVSSRIAFCRATTSTPGGPGDFVAYEFPEPSSGYWNFPSLAVAGNLPCMVCTDLDGVELYFRHATTALPDLADWQQYTLFDSVDEASGPSLSLLDGKPALSFFSGNTVKFYWAREELPLQVAGWLPAEAADQGGAGTSVFTVSDGLPLVAYSRWENNESKIYIAVAREQ